MSSRRRIKKRKPKPAAATIRRKRAAQNNHSPYLRFGYQTLIEYGYSLAREIGFAHLRAPATRYFARHPDGSHHHADPDYDAAVLAACHDLYLEYLSKCCEHGFWQVPKEHIFHHTVIVPKGLAAFQVPIHAISASLGKDQRELLRWKAPMSYWQNHLGTTT